MSYSVYIRCCVIVGCDRLMLQNHQSPEDDILAIYVAWTRDCLDLRDHVNDLLPGSPTTCQSYTASPPCARVRRTYVPSDTRILICVAIWAQAGCPFWWYCKADLKPLFSCFVSCETSRKACTWVRQLFSSETYSSRGVARTVHPLQSCGSLSRLVEALQREVLHVLCVLSAESLFQWLAGTGWPARTLQQYASPCFSSTADA